MAARARELARALSFLKRCEQRERGDSRRDIHGSARHSEGMATGPARRKLVRRRPCQSRRTAMLRTVLLAGAALIAAAATAAAEDFKIGFITTLSGFGAGPGTE